MTVQSRSHIRYDTAKKRLFALALGEGQVGTPEIYMILSPSHGGKTHLKNAFVSEAMNTLPSSLNLKAEVPLLEYEIDSPVRGSFDYVALYRALIGKVLPHAGSISDRDVQKTLIHGLAERKTKWVVIDEGHMLLNASSGSNDQERMANQLESLKGLVNKTGIRLLLFGGPKLARACQLHSHFKNRAITILMGAYSGRLKEDRDEFHRLVQATMIDHEVKGYRIGDPDNRKAFETTLTIMNRCQGLPGLFWKSMALSKREYGADLSVGHVLEGLPSPIGMESVIQEVEEMRRLEAIVHPISDLEFAGQGDPSPPPDLVVSPGSSGPAKPSKRPYVGSRGKVRDPGCSVA